MTKDSERIKNMLHTKGSVTEVHLCDASHMDIYNDSEFQDWCTANNVKVVLTPVTHPAWVTHVRIKQTEDVGNDRTAITTTHMKFKERGDE